MATDMDTRTLLREEELIDDHVVGVDLIACEFLNKTLCLVQGQEFGDADANESSLLRVLEFIRGRYRPKV